EPGERFMGTKGPRVVQWSLGDVLEADGKTRHTGLRVRLERGAFLMMLRTAGGIHQEVGNEVGDLRFSGRPKDAPVVHFAGQLPFLLRTPPKLVPGQEAHFIALVGTAGRGTGAAAYCHADSLGKCKLVGKLQVRKRAAAAGLVEVKCKPEGY